MYNTELFATINIPKVVFGAELLSRIVSTIDFAKYVLFLYTV